MPSTPTPPSKTRSVLIEQLGPTLTGVVGSGPVGASEQESSSHAHAAARGAGLEDIVVRSLCRRGTARDRAGPEKDCYHNPARR